MNAGVLFDLDGTLVDTNYLHTLAWSRALRDAGEWAPMNEIHRLVGMGGEDLLIELLGHDSPDARTARATGTHHLSRRPFPSPAPRISSKSFIGRDSPWPWRPRRPKTSWRRCWPN